MAVEADAERGLVMRMLLHSPKDMVAGLLAFAAVCAIVSNALFMQAGRHPSPMFGGGVGVPMVAPAIPLLPRPRPVEADAGRGRACETEAARYQAGRAACAA